MDNPMFACPRVEFVKLGRRLLSDFGSAQGAAALHTAAPPSLAVPDLLHWLLRWLPLEPRVAQPPRSAPRNQPSNLTASRPPLTSARPLHPVPSKHCSKRSRRTSRRRTGRSTPHNPLGTTRHRAASSRTPRFPYPMGARAFRPPCKNPRRPATAYSVRTRVMMRVQPFSMPVAWRVPRRCASTDRCAPIHCVLRIVQRAHLTFLTTPTHAARASQRRGQ